MDLLIPELATIFMALQTRSTATTSAFRERRIENAICILLQIGRLISKAPLYDPVESSEQKRAGSRGVGFSQVLVHGASPCGQDGWLIEKSH